MYSSAIFSIMPVYDIYYQVSNNYYKNNTNFIHLISIIISLRRPKENKGLGEKTAITVILR